MDSQQLPAASNSIHASLTPAGCMVETPRCVACDSNLTVQHILIECGDFAEVKQKYHDAQNLQKNINNISKNQYYICFDFLHKMELFYRI